MAFLASPPSLRSATTSEIKMSHTIHKYLLLPSGISNGSNGPKIPHGAKLLSVGVQNGSAYLWALVNPENPLRERLVVPAGTGHTLPPAVVEAPFLGTVHIDGLVFHFFDLGEV